MEMYLEFVLKEWSGLSAEVYEYFDIDFHLFITNNTGFYNLLSGHHSPVTPDSQGLRIKIMFLWKHVSVELIISSTWWALPSLIVASWLSPTQYWTKDSPWHISSHSLYCRKTELLNIWNNMFNFNRDIIIWFLLSSISDRNLHSLFRESSTVFHFVLGLLRLSNTLHSHKGKNYWWCLVIFLACSNTES